MFRRRGRLGVLFRQFLFSGMTHRTRNRVRFLCDTDFIQLVLVHEIKSVRFRFKGNSYPVGFAVRSKSTFHYVRSHELLPPKCWKLVFLASDLTRAFSKIYPELFPASPGGQLQEITLSTFSIQTGYNRPSDRKKRCCRSDRG